MTFYEELLEHDLNPYILFNDNGKIKNFNSEAEFLFNFITPKELFDLAVSYASTTYGFKKEFISLKYSKQSFYAILVGYVNEDEIVLRLYKEVVPIESIKLGTNLQKTNIYTLIELSKNTTLLNSSLKIVETFDVSIPEIKININNFLLALNLIFEQISTLKYVELKVYIQTGEYEIIDKKKYGLIAIEFKHNQNYIFDTLAKSKNCTINTYSDKNKIKIEVPLIL